MVDAVNDTGLGGGLAAAGGAGDQDHAVLDIGQIHDLIGDAKLQIAGNVKGHDPHHGGQRTPLLIRIDPEPGQTGQGEGKIVISPVQKALHGPACLGVKFRHELGGLLGKNLLLAEGYHPLIQLFADRAAGHDKQVGGAVVHRPLQMIQ